MTGQQGLRTPVLRHYLICSLTHTPHTHTSALAPRLVMGHEVTMCGFVCKENQDARANFYWLREASNLPANPQLQVLTHAHARASELSESSPPVCLNTKDCIAFMCSNSSFWEHIKTRILMQSCSDTLSIFCPTIRGRAAHKQRRSVKMETCFFPPSEHYIMRARCFICGREWRSSRCWL